MGRSRFGRDGQAHCGCVECEIPVSPHGDILGQLDTESAAQGNPSERLDCGCCQGADRVGIPRVDQAAWKDSGQEGRGAGQVWHLGSISLGRGGTCSAPISDSCTTL